MTGTDLSGQVALVTGASRGFGAAAGAAMADAGAHLLALGRTTGALEALDDRIKGAGGQATLIPLDITDNDGLARMGAAIHGRWGRLDLWLHTAAYAPPLGPAAHLGAKETDQAISVNLRAFERLIHVLDPLLRAAPEGTALIAADPEAVGAKFHGLYGATKAAQSAITRSWSAESAGRIRVVEVVPPPMPTALRGRFHPGEAREPLTPPEAAAARLMAELGAAVPGSVLRL
ncbi:MAG: SDR family NAD(P)-dependent oxidoreductase [Pseudomonadota bacterium]